MTVRLADFEKLLDELHRDPDEKLSVCYFDTEFHAVQTTVEKAPAVAAVYAAFDVWFSAQPLHPRVRFGKGFAKDVIGVRGLPVDLDVKPGGMPSWEAARAVIGDLSEMLGSPPAAVVATGHGLQPHWPIERGEGTDWPNESDPRHGAATALWRRWGRLAATVAERHHGAVDSVWNLDRILRVPGTTNRAKNPDSPLAVTVEFSC